MVFLQNCASKRNIFASQETSHLATGPNPWKHRGDPSDVGQSQLYMS